MPFRRPDRCRCPVSHRQRIFAAPDTEAERKYVTVLSVDIVSPLDAFASVDPELIMRQIGPLIESTFGIVELHGGIVSTSGLSHVTAVFGALPASRHHAVSACRAALICKVDDREAIGGQRPACEPGSVPSGPR